MRRIEKSQMISDRLDARAAISKKTSALNVSWKVNWRVNHVIFVNILDLILADLEVPRKKSMKPVDLRHKSAKQKAWNLTGSVTWQMHPVYGRKGLSLLERLNVSWEVNRKVDHVTFIDILELINDDLLEQVPE